MPMAPLHQLKVASALPAKARIKRLTKEVITGKGALQCGQNKTGLSTVCLQLKQDFCSEDSDVCTDSFHFKAKVALLFCGPFCGDVLEMSSGFSHFTWPSR